MTSAPLSPRGDGFFSDISVPPLPIIAEADEAVSDLSFNFDVTTPQVSTRSDPEAKANSPVPFVFDFNDTTPRVS